MTRKGWRKWLRTLVLALAACVALFWGAVEIAGVPTSALVESLAAVAIGLGVVIAAAALPGALLSWRRSRRSERD